MNLKPAPIAVAVFLSNPAAATDAIQACYDRAKTQLEANRCADSDFQTADKELNAVYQTVLKKHKENAKSLKSSRQPSGHG